MRVATLAIALFLAAPTFADVPPPDDRPLGPSDYPLASAAEIEKGLALLDECLQRGPDYGGGYGQPEKCIGAVAIHCGSVVGSTGPDTQTLCQTEEVRVWDAFIARALPDVREHLGPERTATLEKVQAEWLVWRESKCGWWRDNASDPRWGKFLASTCFLYETAWRALEIREMKADSF